MTTRKSGAVARMLWLVSGLFCVGLGIIGAFLPLLPTTIFLILAAGCFARSSPRLEHWLLNHHRFGPTLCAWQTEGAISRKAKTMAVGGMAMGYALFYFTAQPKLWLTALVGVILAACAGYVLSRPDPKT